jgi:hypothetical protein
LGQAVQEEPLPELLEVLVESLFYLQHLLGQLLALLLLMEAVVA